MKLNFWPFNRKVRRQARWVLNVRKDIPLADLIAILQRHTPVLGAREYNRLPVELQAYFVRAGK